VEHTLKQLITSFELAITRILDLDPVTRWLFGDLSGLTVLEPHERSKRSSRPSNWLLARIRDLDPYSRRHSYTKVMKIPSGHGFIHRPNALATDRQTSRKSELALRNQARWVPGDCAIAFKSNGKPHLRSRNGSRLGKAPRDHEWTPGRREAYQSCCASSRNLVGRRIGHIVGLYLRGFLKQFVQFSQHFRIAPAVVSVRLFARIP